MTDWSAWTVLDRWEEFMFVWALGLAIVAVAAGAAAWVVARVPGGRRSA
jgi:hypothetical protein